MPRPFMGAIALTAALALMTGSASAGTTSVTSAADSGPGSLRAALAAAVPGDTIVVPAGTFTLTSASLNVATRVTIRGAGARSTIIDGGGAYDVFTVNAPGTAITDLEVTHGHGADGAGISSNAALTLSRVSVLDNVATGSGGGMYLGGTGSVTLDHSLIAHNQAVGGGGVYFGGGPNSTITDTTIDQNTATNVAGGLYIVAPGLTLVGDTLFANSAGQGGNFRLGSAGLSMQMGDTILGGGTASGSSNGGDCYLGGGTSWTSLGGNTEDVDPSPDAGGPDTCQYYFNPGLGDRTGLALKLGPLQDNGGPTDTIAPLAGSPVINAAGSTCPADDQRGVARPQGSACDSGAVELSTPSAGAGFAGSITTSTALLHANPNTRGLGGTAHFLYGPTPGLGASTPPIALAGVTTDQPVSAALSGLQPNTTYYFAVVVSTADGTVTASPSTLHTAAVVRPTPKPVCRVPKLVGLSLSSAKRRIRSAHCALGRVTKPRHPRGTLVVTAQRPKAGSSRASGSRINLTLGKPPARKRRR